MSKLLVIGSTNTDMVIQTKRFPKPGETIIGGTFLINPGGKGANQAVAAARLGAKVTFITRLGNDIFADTAQKNFANEGIDTSCITIDEHEASGTALITVNEHGENTIVVASGANNTLSKAHIASFAGHFDTHDFLLMQLEVPLATVLHAFALATQAGAKTILNPAPAQQLPAELFDGLFLITPNETEAEILTHIAVTDQLTAKSASDKLKEMGVQNVIITLGSKGAWVAAGDQEYMVPAPLVKPIDTTAAGDIFNGALAHALTLYTDWKPAVEFACRAASISVTRLGAQASAPTAAELSST
jgi:ribokinase